MKRDCRKVETLLGRPESDLAHAEQQKLSAHLSQCEACRAEAGMLRVATDLLQRPTTTLSEHARERAFATAYARAYTVNDVTPSWRRVHLSIAVAVAAAVLLTVVSAWPRSEPVAREQTRQAPAPAAHALPEPAPVIAVAPATEPAPAPRGEGWIDARATELRHFAHAKVTLAAGTRARFDVATSTLELRRGRVEVDVDPRPHAPFAVMTQHFRVEVLGTQFTVTPERVDVQHGKVRVLDREGRLIAPRLTRGKSYVRRTSDAETSVRGARAAELAPSSAEVLTRAREALAGRRLVDARDLLDRLDGMDATRAERAEAATLRAECALLDHDVAAAIEAYLKVSNAFGDLPAADNALFAAAQLAAKQRDDVRARALLERYLIRYPEGRFAADARARLTRGGTAR